MLLCVAWNITVLYLYTVKHNKDCYVQIVYIEPIAISYIEYLLLRSATDKYLEMLIRCPGRQIDRYNGHKTQQNLFMNILKNNRKIQIRQY